MGLTLSGIRVAFGDVVALDDVSLTVADGAVVGVIGPNGAGKTTLFNVVCGLVTPRAGAMTLDGAPLRPRPERLTRLGIARTLQGLGLFASLTVLENVVAGATNAARTGTVAALLGLPRAAADERALRAGARALLAELELEPYGDVLPGTLPYALRKRVALARALASRPRLLLLDEPAGGLAADEIDELAELLRRLPGAPAVLLVEHTMELVLRACDEVVVLDLGRVIAAGPPAQIRSDPAVAQAYLGAVP